MNAAATTEDLARLASTTDDRVRKDGMQALLRSLAPAFRRQARRLCVINGVSASKHLDDVHQLVLETAWRTICDMVINPDKLANLPSLEQRVWVAARPVVRSEMDKAKSPASGMVSAQRRMREVQRTMAELFNSTGAVPTQQEVVEATNARLARLRSDPARQGLVVTEATLFEVSPALDVSQLPLASTGAGMDEGLACRQVMAATIRRADQHGASMGRAARLYLAEAEHGAGPDVVDVLRHIARELGLTVRSARALVERVRSILAEEMANEGIIESPAQSRRDPRPQRTHLPPPGQAVALVAKTALDASSP